MIFGTRPEHLTLADAGGIAAQVVVMEPTGMDTFVACRHEGVDLSAVFRERHDFAPGSTIHLLPDLQRAHLFDAGTGQRAGGLRPDPFAPPASRQHTDHRRRHTHDRRSTAANSSKAPPASPPRPRWAPVPPSGRRPCTRRP